MKSVVMSAKEARDGTVRIIDRRRQDGIQDAAGALQWKRRSTDDAVARAVREAQQEAGMGIPRPQYRVIAAGMIEKVPVVGLKPRRLEPEKAEKTFSVQGMDSTLVEALKDWARGRGVTIKSTCELAFSEFLKNHPRG